MFGWITGLMAGGGYAAIAFLMFAENVFPPLASELIMPLAGYEAARGELDIALVVLAGSAGSLLGALLWYGVGRWIGCERLQRFAERRGRLLTLHPADVREADRWFDRHGGTAVFAGRLVPAVRTLISVPAGIAAMAMTPFLVYSTLGTTLWTAVLALAGFWLEGSYDQTAAWLDPVSNAIVAVALAWYLYRVATFRRRTG